jgi:peptidoglycan/LPS O-acetylase OafA/YrhL
VTVGLVQMLNRLDERVLGPPRPRVRPTLRVRPLRLAAAGAALAVLAGVTLPWPVGWSLGRLYAVVGGGLVLVIVLAVLRRPDWIGWLQRAGGVVAMIPIGSVIELLVRPRWSSGPAIALVGGLGALVAMVLATRPPRRRAGRQRE